MKNLKPFITKFFKQILFISLVVLAISCQEKQDPCEDTITKEDIQAMKENHLIDLNDAVKMYDKYDKLRIKFFKDSLKRRYGNDFKDTRNVWFDIKTIKAYIKYIEENASDAEGLAFYFGVKSSEARKGKNHQSFFIAPTVKNGERQSGFTIKNGKRVFLYEAFKEMYASKDMQKAGMINLFRDDDGLLLNEGGQNPPGTGD